MKKIIFGLSLLMSITGTTNSFGSTKNDKSHNHTQTTVTTNSHNHSVSNDRNNHCTCHNCLELTRRQQSNNHNVGGYTQQRSLTKQEQKLFKNTYKGKDKLTPISVSTQVVNGTNYKFICKDKHGKKVTVIIYQSLPHQGSKSKIVSITK